MSMRFRTYVRFTPDNLHVDEAEFDRFSEAAFVMEDLLPELLECHVSADLDAQHVDLELVLAARDEREAERLVESITGAIAHQVDVLAGRATSHGATTRTERLAPA